MRKLTTLIVLVLLFVVSCKRQHEFYGHLYDQPAYNFELTDHEGKRVRLSDFTNQKNIVLLFFGYTHCPDVCPMALETMAKVMKNLTPEEAKRVQVLFISVDPERDTPEVLKGYVPYFNPTFIGLTGTEKEIEKTAREYKAYYKRIEGESAGGYLIDHTATIYLVTPDMKIKLLYTFAKQEPEKMAEDIKFLLKNS
ncbi:SCO family protein [Hydrogenobacter sp. T-2]|uniref:SCO family protein n=1 Tax=Pampinifervens diazotrophicum TaxID=1632018 RepID=UPI002B25667B|nr:SCO family protein [Hydrogenobacter sp. T-2]WPM33011.1 SCO family protein [Hydrogenobacter sp. T-2]